jgi:hypothetical protein
MSLGFIWGKFMRKKQENQKNCAVVKRLLKPMDIP